MTRVFWSFAAPVILLLLFFALVGLYGVPTVTDRVDRAERQRDRAVLEQLVRDLPARLRTIAHVHAGGSGAADGDRRPAGPGPGGLEAVPGLQDAMVATQDAPGPLPAPLQPFADALRAGARLDTAGYAGTDDRVFALAAVSDPDGDAGLLLARPLEATVLADWQAHLHGQRLRVEPAAATGVRALPLTGPDGAPVASLGWDRGTLPEAVFHDLAMPLSLLFAFTAFVAALILVRALYDQQSLRGAYADIQGKNDRLRAEIASRQETEARQRVQAAAIDTAADGVCIVDDQGDVAWVNAAFTRTIGLPASEIVGRRPEVFCADRRRGHTWPDIWQTVRGGTVWRGQLRIAGRAGDTRVTDSVVTALLHPLKPDHGGSRNARTGRSATVDRDRGPGPSGLV